MTSVPFKPSRLFVDRAVEFLPLTQKILRKFSSIPVDVIDDLRALKKPTDMTWAKKGLLLARMKADPIKEFKAMSQSSRRPYYSLDLISNCHLECTYCILQSYLENNPVITIFTNMDEILERLGEQIRRLPAGSVIGTGKIADSLALDAISEHTKAFVPFFAGQDRVILELKTKNDDVSNLIGLNHNGRTIVSWSMNPQAIIDREEYKTASFEERLEAARRVVRDGYPVAFHFDPMILHEGWDENYSKTVEGIFAAIPSDRIAWMSVGTLRFPARQGRLMRERFPKNQLIHEQLASTNRRVLHYPHDSHEMLIGKITDYITCFLPADRMYRCMDFGDG